MTAGAEHGIIPTCGGRGIAPFYPMKPERSGPGPPWGARDGEEEGTEMIQQLSGPDKVVGAKQVRRALRDGRAARLFMAMDADPRLLQPLVQEAVRRQVPVEQVPSMKELGAACGIAVGAAVAVLLNG